MQAVAGPRQVSDLSVFGPEGSPLLAHHIPAGVGGAQASCLAKPLSQSKHHKLGAVVRVLRSVRVDDVQQGGDAFGFSHDGSGRPLILNTPCSLAASGASDLRPLLNESRDGGLCSRRRKNSCRFRAIPV